MAKEDMHKLCVRIPETQYQRLCYWAEKNGMSAAQYLSLCIDRSIDIENGAAVLPDIQAQRINQISDAVLNIAQRMQKLEQTCYNGLDTIIALAQGDDYRWDDEKEQGKG